MQSDHVALLMVDLAFVSLNVHEVSRCRLAGPGVGRLLAKPFGASHIDVVAPGCVFSLG